MEKISRIIFVCTGNICRSPAAEGFGRIEAAQRGLAVEISSAGLDGCVGMPASRSSLIACRELGIDISAHRASQVTPQHDSAETLFAVMTSGHRQWLIEDFSVPAEHIAILGGGIPDPFGMPLPVYRSTCRALKAAVHQLFDTVSPLLEPAPEGAWLPAVEPMTPDDAAAAAELERECFSDPWSERSFAEELENPLADMLAVRSHGRLCGYGCIISAGGISELPKICISPDFRRLGAGRLLLAELAERARLRGSSQLTLEVRVSNTAAISLYRSSFFEEIGVRPGFYSSPKEDAMIMTRTIPQDQY